MGLWNWLLGRPDHFPWFVERMNHDAEDLRYPIMWDDVGANVCWLTVKIDGREYLLHVRLLSGRLWLFLHAKADMEDLPAGALRRTRKRCRNLPVGRMDVDEIGAAFMADLPIDEYGVDFLRDAIHVARSEIGAIDLKYLNAPAAIAW